MNILHTSDLHLGRSFHGYSREVAFAHVCNEILSAANHFDCSVVIIAGDIFDSGNPPASAERQYFELLRDLTEKQSRAVVVIAGNHDSIARLEAPASLLQDRGIFVFARPDEISDSHTSTGNIPFPWKINSGLLSLNFNDEVIEIVPIPFLSDARLGKLTQTLGIGRENFPFSRIIKLLVDKALENASEKSSKILVTHQLFWGGKSSSCERIISVNDSHIVYLDDIPQSIDYVAMGHLHIPQNIGKRSSARYSGSPISFDFEALSVPRSLTIVSTDDFAIRQYPIADPCPPEIWNYCSFSALTDALRDENNKDRFLAIVFDETLDPAQLREISSLHPRVIKIFQKGEIDSEDSQFTRASNREHLSDRDFFIQFYKHRTDRIPPDTLVDTFLEILGSE